MINVAQFEIAKDKQKRNTMHENINNDQHFGSEVEKEEKREGDVLYS